MPDVSATTTRFVTVVAILLITACAAPRHEAPPANFAAPESDESSDIAIDDVPSQPATAEVPLPVHPTSNAAPVATPDLWSALIARHAFVDCADPPPAVRHWERIYAQPPKRHAEALAAAAPWIAHVAEELARRELPAEFVWLPFVESRYQPFRSSGNRPAGAWQLMPATARGRGLRIADDYDGRLDFVAATRTALDLIEHLAAVFDHDWSLVTMAYNAGEFRIKRALANARKSGHSTHPEHLAVSSITHAHLVKLRALSCIPLHPERIGLTLPTIDATQYLRTVVVPKAMNVSQLAALSGVSESQWLQWNPAWRRGHVDADAMILLPQALVDRSVDAIALATPTPIEGQAIATVARGERSHVVRSGESAWSIARRHRVSLAALLAANGLGKSPVLRPGQMLRLP